MVGNSRTLHTLLKKQQHNVVVDGRQQEDSVDTIEKAIALHGRRTQSTTWWWMGGNSRT